MFFRKYLCLLSKLDDNFDVNFDVTLFPFLLVIVLCPS